MRSKRGIIATSFLISLVMLISALILRGVTVKAPVASPKDQLLKMGSNFLRSSKHLDPARITNLEEYELVRNLYSRLVEYNANGELISGAADSFQWQGPDLVFSFGQKVQTIEGDFLTAADASVSLKRAIYLEKTGHGDLRTFLCPNTSLKSLVEDCPGIKVIGNKLILRPVKASLGAHLIALLESADFSIIPRNALNADSQDPYIKSHRNTSGPFYVEMDADDGGWILKANPRHYHYSNKIPQTVQLVPATSSNVAQLFTERNIDLVPTPIFLSSTDAEQAIADRSKVSVHESIPIKVLMACFTPSAVRRFSVEQRMFAASLIEKFLTTNFAAPGSKPTVELFQAMSDGSLTAESRDSLKAVRTHPQRPRFTEPLRVAAVTSSFDRVKAALSGYPEVEVVKTEVPAYQLPLNERPDLYVVSSDSAWTESLSLLGHNFRVGIFHKPGVDGDKWIKDYADIEDRETRIEALTSLHESLLRSVVIYPIYVSPYTAVAHKPWKLSFSTFSAGTELWRISLEQ